MANNYSRFFAVIKQINSQGGHLSKEQAVSEFTQGRTDKLGDLSLGEFQELERSLIRLAGTSKPSAAKYKDDPLDKARKAIIAHFKSIGRTTEDAITWAEKYGVNGVKKRFNDYNGQELWQLVQNSKKVKSDFIIAANRKL